MQVCDPRELMNISIIFHELNNYKYIFFIIDLIKTIEISNHMIFNKNNKRFFIMNS